jgi:hypothetical protein
MHFIPILSHNFRLIHNTGQLAWLWSLVLNHTFYIYYLVSPNFHGIIQVLFIDHPAKYILDLYTTPFELFFTNRFSNAKFFTSQFGAIDVVGNFLERDVPCEIRAAMIWLGIDGEG